MGAGMRRARLFVFVTGPMRRFDEPRARARRRSNETAPIRKIVDDHGYFSGAARCGMAAGIPITLAIWPKGVSL